MISALATFSRAAAVLAAVAAFAAPSSADDAASASPAGVWLDDRGRGAIEITACGEGLCGRLVWVKDKKEERSACGLQIIGDVKRIDAATWNGGWIYSPELKTRFNVELKPGDNGTLVVTGYAGSRMLSETMIWHRAPADLGRCGVSTERAGYVAARVEPKEALAAVAETTGTVTAAAAASEIKTRVAAKEQAPARKTAARAARAHVASRDNDRPHRHTASCHVRAPFVNVSFGCSQKASRILARLF